MIRVSKLTDYGVLLLSTMSSNGPKDIHNARHLSQQTHVPLPMVSKILKKLTHAKLIISHRGTKGGYRLARDSEDISLAEMITALEGPISVTECVSLSPTVCDKKEFCPLCNGWEIVNETILSALSGISLASLRNSFNKQPNSALESCNTETKTGASNSDKVLQEKEEQLST